MTASYSTDSQPQSQPSKPPIQTKWGLITAALLGISVTCILTKPNKQAYVDNISPHFINSIQGDVCTNLLALPKQLSGVGQIIQSSCRSGISSSAIILGEARLQEFIKYNSRRQHDCILFNVWVTEIPGKKITKVGILGQFIALPNH
ncbi:DUF4359 domain-containing protein [filamentous cyanobacterium LEGE 11480]|uniref:DUF4359 domain-containing protein n=1 Tax=Romeriopsis navalis LEGE 11480 TaxID=2777977 RepID=A0A928Z5C0_9CYAN|nr:DUF4359 domain-containing protein [Romeriopsis navalis]MBE9031100.1 DUF4359 domain-containing protein [Romeriopsis navalis LEGE 11480]